MIDQQDSAMLKGIPTVTAEQTTRAALYAASKAHDAEDLRMLLDMLGIGDELAAREPVVIHGDSGAMVDRRSLAMLTGLSVRTIEKIPSDKRHSDGRALYDVQRIKAHIDAGELRTRNR